MFRNCTLAAAALWYAVAAPVHADPPPSVVQISGSFGTSLLAVQANYNGTTFVGGGKITAQNGSVYLLRVTSGVVFDGHYVRLTGIMVAPNGVATPFTLFGDSVTDAFLLIYTGSNGATFQITGKGAVFIL